MDQKVMALDYVLYRDSAEGEKIESTEGNQPLVFLTGAGQMIPEFESNVSSLNAGDEFSFGIEAENAYGMRQEEAVMDLPKEIFMEDGKLIEGLEVGNVVPLQDQEGRVHRGIVKAMGEQSVTMDMNHPLAGQNLYFTGKIVEVREATAEEISHGHAHGPGGHEH